MKLLLTRQQVIDMWLQQSKEQLNTLCCPYCRDLLFATDSPNKWKCFNCDKTFNNDKENINV